MGLRVWVTSRGLKGVTGVPGTHSHHEQALASPALVLALCAAFSLSEQHVISCMSPEEYNTSIPCVKGTVPDAMRFAMRNFLIPESRWDVTGLSVNQTDPCAGQAGKPVGMYRLLRQHVSKLLQLAAVLWNQL